MRICEYCAREGPCGFEAVETEGAYCCTGYIPIFRTDSAGSPPETADKAPRKMKLVLSPYSHADPLVREARFRAVCKYCAKLISNGIYAFSPVIHCHPIAQYGIPFDYNFWGGWGSRFFNICDEVIVYQLDGWEDSIGIKAEVEILKAMGLPIIYVEPEDNE